jgi:hypothetical protein
MSISAMNYTYAGNLKNDAGFGLQSKAHQRLALTGAASQLGANASGSIFQTGGHGGPAFGASIFALHEADKDLQTGMLQDELMYTISRSMEESAKKLALEKAKESYTIA